MTDRAIFNRKYTEYTPGTIPVWLVNGQGVTTSAASVREFVAGAELVAGSVVALSGALVIPASAASGTQEYQQQAIGIATQAAAQGSGVDVNLDDIVLVGAGNITAGTELVPGQYYFLSKEEGQLTQFTTSSGTVTAASGYASLVNLGLALSTTELHVEVQTPVDLYS